MASPFDTAAGTASLLPRRDEPSPLPSLGLQGDDWGFGARAGGNGILSLLYNMLLAALRRDLDAQCRCECPTGGGGAEADAYSAYQRQADESGLPSDVEGLDRRDTSQYGRLPDSAEEPSRYGRLNDPSTREWTGPSTEQFDDALPADVSALSRRPGAMPEPTGVVEVNEPIVVKAGEVFDGGGKLYKAGPGLGDGSQSEGQQPIFILEDGATLRNVQLAGADGVHTYGDARLENVWWRDVGEDALTMKARGNVVIIGGGAYEADDKIFQLNAGGSFKVFGFHADGFGKAIRTNGGKEFDIDIQVHDSVFANGEEAVVRTDAHGARVALNNVQAAGLKSEVLAPVAANVSGTDSVGYKAYSG